MPPGASPTTTVIGRLEKSCARAAATTDRLRSAARAAQLKRRRIMLSAPVRSRRVKTRASVPGHRKALIEPGRTHRALEHRAERRRYRRLGKFRRIALARHIHPDQPVRVVALRTIVAKMAEPRFG